MDSLLKLFPYLEDSDKVAHSPSHYMQFKEKLQQKT